MVVVVVMVNVEGSGVDTHPIDTSPPLRVVVTKVQPPRWVRTTPGMGSPAEFSAVMPPQ